MTRKFSASGRLTEWTEPNGDTFTRLYDASGRVEEEIDALGNSTTYDYDAAGRLETIRDVALDATTRFVRDSAGRVTDTTDALNHTTHTSYRSGGRLETATNARGFTTSFDQTPTSSSITDALTRSTTTTLTNYGLPTATAYPGVGSPSTSSLYDGTTRLDGSQRFPTSFADEQGRDRDFVYDARSGLTSATDLAGNAWQYSYAASKGGAISYDVFSGNVAPSQQDGGASAYQGGGGTEYRDVGTVGGGAGGMFQHYLDSVTSPRGETTQFVRGENGRVERVIYPDGGEKRITYDSKNQPGLFELPQDQVVTLGRDTLGRETNRVVYDRNGAALTPTGEFRNLTYGVSDRIETMTDPTGTTTYSYDAMGRFSGITYPHGGSVMYTRDKLGRTTAVKVKPTASASEIATHYEYDENGNVAEITDPNGGVTAFAYDHVDRLTSRLLPNGVATSYSYDDRDRVLTVVHKNASNVVIASVTYVRSASGEPTKVTREDGSYTDIEYDAALHVKKESEHDANSVLIAETSYEYDADGNRTSKTTLSGEQSYSYAAGFTLTGSNGVEGNEVYDHDAGGRLVGIERGGVQRTIEYDSRDRITRVTDGGIEQASYTFDGAGHRVSANGAEGVRRFLTAPSLGDGFSGPQAVTDAQGSLLAAFVYSGGDAPFMKITPTGVEYLLGDALGSVIGKVDSAGASTASIKYTVFGEISSAVGPAAGIDPEVGSEPRLHGMLYDAATALYFVRARSYDPRTGRFLTRDPIAGIRHEPETANPYPFSRQAPSIWKDPSGHFATMAEVGAVGAIANVMAGLAGPTFNALNLMRGRNFLLHPADDAKQSEHDFLADLFGTSLPVDLIRVKFSNKDYSYATRSDRYTVNIIPEYFEDPASLWSPIKGQHYDVLAHEVFHLWQYRYVDSERFARHHTVQDATESVTGKHFWYDWENNPLITAQEMFSQFINADIENQASMFAYYAMNQDDERFMYVSVYVKNPTPEWIDIIKGPGY